MSEKKYGLGSNKPMDLVMKYLGWFPEGLQDWEPVIETPLSEVTMVSPDHKERIELLMWQQISKDAFPLEFFGDKRSVGHHRFCIVSEKKKPTVRFIIPMH